MHRISAIVIILVVGVLAIFGGAYIYLSPGRLAVPGFASNLPSSSASSTTYPPISIGNGKPIAGIMGAHADDFSFIKSWGANTVHYYKYPGDTHQIASVLALAKQTGLNVFVSVAKVEQFNNAFDLAGIKANPTRFFPDNQIVAGDRAFLGYWIVDEPCNPKKKSPVQAADFVDLYSTVKTVNPKIPIIINFGTLECLQGFVNASQPGWKLTDIAMFTITEKKLMSQPSYISDQAKIATSIKAFDPNIKILPQLAVLEFKQVGAPMTPASWAQSAGLETAKYLGSFDGVLYYSFRAYENVKFIGKAIGDVKDDPAYASAFKTVFQKVTK